jgi:stage III sporulation protein AB
MELLIKSAGCLMVILSGILAGFYASGELKRQINLIEDVLVVMEIMDNHTMYSKKTFLECFRYLKNKSDGVCKQWTCAIYNDLLSGNGKNFVQVWQSRLTILKQNGLKGEELDVINEFGSNLANSDRKMLIRMHEIYIERLRHIHDKLQAEYAKKSGMYRSLGIMAGLLIAVILI